MKVAVSIPDEVFDKTDRLARSLGQSRSAIYTRALSEFVRAHAPEEVTAAIDQVLAGLHRTSDEHAFAKAAARRTLTREDW